MNVRLIVIQLRRGRTLNVQMELTKVVILICCIYYTTASHHSQTIPIEGYETELQVLGQHVEIPETPVKVIKITKTVAVKVPVPYPVKVREKVPYPVHISKPYPVPVPQIVKVPYAVPISPKHSEHEALDIGHGRPSFENSQQFNGQGPQYQVQEEYHDVPASGGHSNYQNHDFGDNNEDHSSGISADNSYDSSPNNYNGYSDDNEKNGSFESHSYDRAIQNYLNNRNNNGNNGDSKHLHYH